jgi:hypothetical protein
VHVLFAAHTTTLACSSLLAGAANRHATIITLSGGVALRLPPPQNRLTTRPQPPGLQRGRARGKPTVGALTLLRACSTHNLVAARTTASASSPLLTDAATCHAVGVASPCQGGSVGSTPWLPRLPLPNVIVVLLPSPIALTHSGIATVLVVSYPVIVVTHGYGGRMAAVRRTVKRRANNAWCWTHSYRCGAGVGVLPYPRIQATKPSPPPQRQLLTRARTLALFPPPAPSHRGSRDSPGQRASHTFCDTAPLGPTKLDTGASRRAILF